MKFNSQPNSVGLCLVHLPSHYSANKKRKKNRYIEPSQSHTILIFLSLELFLLSKEPKIMSSNNTADSPSASPDSSSDSFFQEIFISFVALSSLFIVLCLVRWFLQRNAARSAPLPVARSAPLPVKRRTGGLDPAAIATLPTFPYRKCGNDNRSDEENIGSSMECSICLSSVEEGEMVKVLPECMHSFHGDCVDLWLSGHTTCPVCRIQVLGSTSAAPHPSRVEMVSPPVLGLEGRP